MPFRATKTGETMFRVKCLVLFEHCSASCVLVIKPKCSQAEEKRHSSFLNLYWQEMASSCFCHKIIHTGWTLAFTNSSSRTPSSNDGHGNLRKRGCHDQLNEFVAIYGGVEMDLSWYEDRQTDYMGMEIRCHCLQIGVEVV